MTNEPKPYYTLSRDYQKLKSLVDAGHKLAGYADYYFLNAYKPPHRDIVSICKHQDTINFGVRGHGYGQCGPFEAELYKMSEDDLFQNTCRSLNLEWIDGVLP